MTWILSILTLAALAILGVRWLVRVVPANPPHVAISWYFGKRTTEIKREGWRLYVPPVYTPQLVSVQVRNHDFGPKIARTSDQGEVEVEKVSFMWKPNDGSGESLIEYLNLGAEGGRGTTPETEVKNNLDDIIGQMVRQELPRRTWEEIQSDGRVHIAVSILDRLTAFPLPDYDTLERMRNTLTNDEIETYTRQALRRGLPDNQRLGIIIYNLTVGEIKARGKFAEALEKQAVESRERPAELTEMETEIQQAQLLVQAMRNAGEEWTMKQAVEFVRETKLIKQGRGFIVPGLKEAAEIVREILRR